MTTKKIKNSFITYESFYETMIGLPVDIRVNIHDAIYELALYNKEIELKGIAKNIFAAIKPQILANNIRYNNSLKGGRKSKRNQQLSDSETIGYVNTKPSVIEKNNHRLSNSETNSYQIQKPNENETENVLMKMKNENQNSNENALPSIQENITNGTSNASKSNVSDLLDDERIEEVLQYHVKKTGFNKCNDTNILMNIKQILDNGFSVQDIKIVTSYIIHDRWYQENNYISLGVIAKPDKFNERLTKAMRTINEDFMYGSPKKEYVFE